MPTKCILPASILIISILAASCSWIGFPGVYKLDIEQGSKPSPERLSQLRVGMNRIQVSYIMGSTLLPDSFDQNHWDYAYSLLIKGKKFTTSHITLKFKDDKLDSIDMDNKALENLNQQASGTMDKEFLKLLSDENLKGLSDEPKSEDDEGTEKPKDSKNGKAATKPDTA